MTDDAKLKIGHGNHHVMFTFNGLDAGGIATDYDPPKGSPRTLTAPITRADLEAIHEWAAAQLGYVKDEPTVEQIAEDTDRAFMENPPVDYSKFPESVSERRSMKSWNAAEWSPRDMLISLLRDIDAGELPGVDCMVVVHSRYIPGDKGATRTGFAVSSPDIIRTLGTMDMGRMRMTKNWIEHERR